MTMVTTLTKVTDIDYTGYSDFTDCSDCTYYTNYGVYVVGQFYPWFKFSFLLLLGMVMYDNEFKTKENKI